MLTFEIKHQESYSRGELLLRSFFGWLYILIPHILLLMFYFLWIYIVSIISWFIILFTGKTPEFYYNTMLGYNRWMTRLNARLMNLSDGYPSFGPNGTDDQTIVDFPHIHGGRGQLLLRSFFEIIYVGIPHGLCLYVRSIASFFLIFAAWWVVLFTGKYPETWHNFNVGTQRWQMRVGLYLSFLYPTYPIFAGKRDQPEEEDKPIDQI